MKLDDSYFVGELMIPGLTGTSPAAIANLAELQWFIDRYGSEYLTLLIDGLATDVIAWYPPGSINPDEGKPEIDYIELLCEQIYATPSPVAAYVYFHFWRNRYTETTSMNEVRMVSENAIIQDGVNKTVHAWNDMVKRSREVWDYLHANSDNYPTFDTARRFPFDKINTFNL